MKFKDMPYVRKNLEEIKSALKGFTEKFNKAATYEEAKTIFLEVEKLQDNVNTASTLAEVRHTIDTRDKFYDEEVSFWNNAGPEIEEYQQEFKKAMLESPFRADFAKEYGDLMFINAEISQKCFSPEIISDMQKENDLAQAYQNLIASAQIPFMDGIYTLSQMTPFKDDADDEKRLAAWKAEGGWYKEHQEELDDIYDKMVHQRDAIGKKLGYDNFIQLGYYRMGRNCYDKKDVEKFRKAVVDYIVPVAEKIYKKQAERLGKSYPMSYADNNLEFRSGNPRPKGSAEDILKAGKKFYDELSPETSEFFNLMLDNELMDVLSTEGKAGGGYCTGLPDYKVPFIFANFNGTIGDVTVITHEAGHGFADYTNRDRIPSEYRWPSMEGCEVHSMSMEFLAWPWSEDFFGDDKDKFQYSHLASALTFIPYGTMVDHFQHLVYEKPEMTPRERHNIWKELVGIYQPWMKLDGDIPFYSEGEGWQRQLHIYEMPFYYIDYCLAQTVALEIWSMMQEDFDKAWKHYMAYTRQGGSQVFTKLLENANLDSPFDENCLRRVSDAASKWLDDFDSAKLV